MSAISRWLVPGWLIALVFVAVVLLVLNATHLLNIHFNFGFNVSADIWPNHPLAEVWPNPT